MNNCVKLALTIFIIGISQNIFSQHTFKSYKKVDIPFCNENTFSSNFLKHQTISDTLWLPASGYEIGSSGNRSTNYIYEYHENGLLKKFSIYSAYDGELTSSYDFNNTYIDPLIDIPDTIFFNGYIHPLTGEYRPPRRYYYNHRQADSSYFEEYYQVWDGERWQTGQKIYVHLLDTATVSEFQHHIEIFDGNGRLLEGGKVFLTFDDKGNVMEALTELYDIATNQYKVSFKHTYLYDDEGKCHTRNEYSYTASGTWRIEFKLTNIKWFDHHGFDNGDLYFFGTLTGLYEGYSPKNKNKVSSLEVWRLYGNTLGLTWIDTIKWETEPFSYHFDHYSRVNCIVARWEYACNEHFHTTALNDWTYDNFYVLPCDPDPVPARYVLNDFINKYDDRGRRYEYIQNQTVHLSSFPHDSILHLTMTYIIDSFTYVLRPVATVELPEDKRTLLIVPNPSGETVRITAGDDITTVSFYASDGRLAYSRNGTGKEMNVNIQGLAKGVYVVQARLRNGTVQTGKVVVK